MFYLSKFHMHPLRHIKKIEDMLFSLHLLFVKKNIFRNESINLTTTLLPLSFIIYSISSVSREKGKIIYK